MRGLLSTSLLAGAFGLLMLTWSGPAAAQGTEFNLSCHDDEVLVGIRGRQGWWMDGIAARCRDVQSNGALSAGIRTTAFRGGDGGTSRTFDCGRNEVMVGYSGSQGDNGYVLYVHEVICAPWQPGTRTAGTPTRTVRAFDKKGGSGHWIADSCFQGKVGTRLRGRAGMYLDRLTDIGCSYAQGATPPSRPVVERPAPPPPSPITTAPTPIGPSGNYNVALCPEPKNPPFSWDPVTGATSYTVEYRNDTLNRTTTRRAWATSTNPPGFREGNRYRWRVRAANSQGEGPWSQYLSFTGVKGNSAEGPCVIGRLYSPF